MLRASRDGYASRDDGQQGSGNAHQAPRNRHVRHGVGYASCADSKRRSNAPQRCPPTDNDIDPQAPSRPSPRGRSATQPPQTQHEGTPAPWEWMGRGFLNGLGGAPNKQLFLYRQRRTFFTANGRFFYRRGGCRHAQHDGGDGGDDKEENSFSDCRHRHPRQGEADSHRHGFL